MVEDLHSAICNKWWSLDTN